MGDTLPETDLVSWQVNDMKKNEIKLWGNCYSRCNKTECVGFSSMMIQTSIYFWDGQEMQHWPDTLWCQGLTVICIWYDSGIMILEENTYFFFPRCVLNLCRDKITWCLWFPLKYFNPIPKNRQRKYDKVLSKMDNDISFVILFPLLMCFSYYEKRVKRKLLWEKITHKMKDWRDLLCFKSACEICPSQAQLL